MTRPPPSGPKCSERSGIDTSSRSSRRRWYCTGSTITIADRRLATITIGGLIAAVATAALAAATGHWVSTAAGALAALALIVFAGVYARVSKPVNTALTAAAVAGRVPGNARQLQARWDSVISERVALQTLALAALCVALAAA